jgi:hypothetical protein
MVTPAADALWDDAIRRQERVARVLAALATCSPLARKVFRLVYATPGGTAATAANELGLSLQRVRQILCETRRHILQGGSLDGLDVGRPMPAFIAPLVAPEPPDRLTPAVDERAALEHAVKGRRAERTALGWLRRGSVLAVAGVAVGLAVSGVGGHAVWSKLRGSPSARRGAASLAKMTEFRDEVCRCQDRQCIDTANDKMTRWSAEMAREMANERAVPPSSSAATTEIADLAKSISECMMRVMIGPVKPAPVKPTVAIEPLEPRIDPAAPGHDLVLGGNHIVGFDYTDVPMHQAILRMARSCGVNVVLPERISGLATGEVAESRCANALKHTIEARGFDYGIVPDGNLIWIGRRDEVMNQNAGLNRRYQVGLYDDRLPQGSEIDLDDSQAPVRSVLETLARAGGVNLELADSIGGSVTVHVERVRWDRALVTLLDANDLGYRYEEYGKRLRIAPRKDIDAEQARIPLRGTLRVVSHDAATRIVIDRDDTGQRTPVPSGDFELHSGQHTVTFIETTGERSSSTVYIPAGGSVTVMHEDRQRR